MKKLTKILALMGAATGVAYLTKKMMDSSKYESSKVPNRGNSNDASKDKNEHRSSRNETSDFSNERTQKMYKDLGMTDEQRLRYETDYRTVMHKWEKENPNIAMDEIKKTAEHNSALKAVLNEAQFSNYRDWADKYVK
ncbi:MAG: hypothetical protein ACSHXF_01420 [Aquaticitalea sp.]